MTLKCEMSKGCRNIAREQIVFRIVSNKWYTFFGFEVKINVRSIVVFEPLQVHQGNPHQKRMGPLEPQQFSVRL